jgi:hypothetical protein
MLYFLVIIFLFLLVLYVPYGIHHIRMLIFGDYQHSLPASIPGSTYTVFRNAFRESLPCTSVNAFMKGLWSLQNLFSFYYYLYTLIELGSMGKVSSCHYDPKARTITHTSCCLN